jgi:DNA-binding LytR/AlgR family response regulator
MTHSIPLRENEELSVRQRSAHRQPRGTVPARRAAADASANPDSTRLVVKRPGGVTLIPIHEIECLEAAGNLVIVHTCDKQTYRIREPLSNLFERVKEFGFIRIHRGTVVRVSAITGVDKGRYRKAYAVLSMGARFEIGRVEFQRLRALWHPGVLDLDELSRGLHLLPDSQ